MTPLRLLITILLFGLLSTFGVGNANAHRTPSAAASRAVQPRAERIALPASVSPEWWATAKSAPTDYLSALPNWTAESDTAVALFGYSVSSAGDVNGDGYYDVIVGARDYDNFGLREGRAFVYHGSAVGLSLTPNWTAWGNQYYAAFGGSVSSAGDVNGDGYDDVIVGAFQAYDGQLSEGTAYVYHGSATGLSRIANWTAEGEQLSAYFGFSVSTAGDVNGDGYADVIVGARYYDLGQSNSDEGRAYVYHGSASGLSAIPNWIADGSSPQTSFGYSVDTAGDVNGDGYSDVIVGSYYYIYGVVNDGQAYVYHGSAAGLSRSADWTADSGVADDGFGFAVAGAGDVNGDGFSDVLVGAPAYDSPVVGQAYGYNGSEAGLSATPSWTGSSPYDGGFGASVASAGDVNDDGYAEVIAGAPIYYSGIIEGQASVFLGSPSGPNSTADWTAESGVNNSSFGYSVSTAGDVNGDGYDDVIVGSPTCESGQTAEGWAFAYHGLGPATWDDTDSAITYDGWAGVRNPQSSGASYRAASASGQTIRLATPLPSAEVALVTYRGPDQGLAQVFIDGADQGTLDLYAPAPEFQHQLVYGGLSMERHRIQVDVLGQQNSASSGTEVRVDSFSAGGTTVEDNGPAVQYSRWTGRVSANAYGGSYRSAARRNASAYFSFIGAQFTWITARCPDCGLAQVTVDGVVVASVDLYSPTVEWQYAQVIAGLAEGAHSVQIRALGMHSEDSTGNTIVFDGYSVP